jgi:8-oxo-dGTP pyrophosphatase MutT (NUDIX family)
MGDAEAALLARIRAIATRSLIDVRLRAEDLAVPGDASQRRAADLPAMPRLSAVLVPIVLRPGGASVLVTRRAAELPIRGGDLVFPGGGVREGESPAQAALREAQEEVGIQAARVELAGYLDAHPTRIGFRIQPVVGFVPGDFEAVPDPREVAEVLELPLAAALARGNRRRVRVEWQQGSHEIWRFEHAGVALWGPPAGMLADLAERLGDAAP